MNGGGPMAASRVADASGTVGVFLKQRAPSASKFPAK
jgi:hypothetical protein